MKLSVVIPAYNEQENIQSVIYDVQRTFPGAEVIIVNDASDDDTSALIRDVKAKVINNRRNMGHGKSVMRGLKAAKGDYILYIDADRQISLTQIKGLIGKYDFVSGYRKHRQDKPFRKIISFILKSTILLKHGFYVKDANCPFKLYRRSAVQSLLPLVPKSSIIPIACLEVLARRYKYTTHIIPKVHKKYHTERKGFLQTINIKSLRFFYDAFIEITHV